jgi:hypothetical protein
MTQGPQEDAAQGREGHAEFGLPGPVTAIRWPGDPSRLAPFRPSQAYLPGECHGMKCHESIVVSTQAAQGRPRPRFGRFCGKQPPSPDLPGLDTFVKVFT